MGLKLGIIPFTKFFTLMSPLLISSFTLLQSAFNSNIKGVIFLLGAAIIMFLGNLISSTLPSRVPNGYDAACNIIDTDAMGWGTYYSSPGPHQLFLWYAATYICTGMFVNGLVNWSLFGLFVTLIIASGVLRYWPTQVRQQYRHCPRNRWRSYMGVVVVFHSEFRRELI